VTSRRGRGEDSVYLDGDRWRGAASLGYGPDGHRIRKKVSGATKGEVLRKLRDLRAELNAGMPSPDDRLTVAAFLDRWLAASLPGQVSDKTLDSYADTVRLHIKPSLGRKVLRKLTVSDIDLLLAWKRNAGYSANTVRIIRAVLRRALKQAEREGLVSRNAAALSVAPRVRSDEGRALSVDQAKALLEQVRRARGTVADVDARVWAAARRGVGLALVGSGLGVGDPEGDACSEAGSRPYGDLQATYASGDRRAQDSPLPPNPLPNAGTG
jgi:Phage integrase, N-terminal SAM-like domain